jgi:hypothetical protein
MRVLLNDSNRKMLEEYLQDLLFGARRKEDLEVLVELLLTLQETGTPKTRESSARTAANNQVNFRCHLYKMSPDGILWIGFVKGMEKSKEILPGLSCEQGSLYFLYDEYNGKVVEFLQNRSQRDGA